MAFALKLMAQKKLYKNENDVKTPLCWNKIQEYLKTHDYIINADVRELYWI